MDKHKKLDFRGQDIFIGMDIHKKSWTVSILTNNFEHKTFNQPPEPLVLVRYLQRNFPGANYHSVYEAGFCGFWIYDRLWEEGIQCMVVHAADVPVTDKEKHRKTDKRDSRKLAKGLRSGQLESLYVPPRWALEDRSFVRVRAKIVKQQTRVKNQIKGFLHFYGITLPGRFINRVWSAAFIKWLENIKMDESSGKMAIANYIDQLKYYLEKRKIINKQIKELAHSERYEKRIECLTSIPGIGVISAMTWLTELVDIHRFKKFDRLASYVGLIPREHSSGEKEIRSRLDSRGNHVLRTVLIENSWVAVRKDPALFQAYAELIKRMHGNKAIIRIARKLLRRIRYVLINEAPYATGVV